MVLKQKLQCLFKIWLAVTSLSTALSCAPIRQAESKPALVGGELAATDQFPALVAIKDCGAAKVSEHIFLTAAHCVVDSVSFQLKPAYSESESLILSTHSRLDTQIDVTIDWVKVHHNYAEALFKVYQDDTIKIKKIAPRDFDHVEDLALIRIIEPTPTIAIMKLHPDFIAVGTELTVAGWGRRYREVEDGSYVVSGTQSDLHSAQVTIDLSASDETVYSLKTQVDQYFETSLSLAPGDSGSPALIAKTTGFLSRKKEWFIAGVNSFANSSRSSIARVDGDRFQCLSQEIARDSANGTDVGLNDSQKLQSFCKNKT